jgi:type II secretory pathway component PulF
MSLAEALGHTRRIFAGPMAMVRAGETGGFSTCPRQIAAFRSREQDLKSKVTSAMIYPAILTVLATGILAFLLTYFIPRFH